ncbi:uncharacterized protein LOC100209530 [Hydra vulgaris]|nr:uncharacterized protein LOC100209530 [Hydra vulgaris]
MIWDQGVSNFIVALLFTKWILQSSNDTLQINQIFNNVPFNKRLVSTFRNLYKNAENTQLDLNIAGYHDLQNLKGSNVYSYEVQNLLSWQNAYHRGDLRLHSELQLSILPVNAVHKGDKKISNSLQTISNVFIDDGYDSSGLSLDSPTSSTLSETRPDYLFSSSSPPFSDNNFENFSSLPGAYSADFDIDDLLDNNDLNLGVETNYKSQSCCNEKEKLSCLNPFSKILDIDHDLDYVSSPLKSPSFDEFLTSPNQGFLTKYGIDISFEDPFEICFTNSSLKEKLLDSSLNIEDYDINELKLEEDVDRALVESLSPNVSKYKVMNDESNEVSKALIEKNAFEVDHDYYQRSDSSLNYTTKSYLNDVAVGARQLTELSHTFAPSHSVTNSKETKSENIWPDFPYTSEELVTMPVDTFNEVIKLLDEIRKHIAKDVRRKGKNKFAARGCRKRKNDLIKCLDIGVDELIRKKNNLLDERNKIIAETLEIRRKTMWLNSYIFMHLRDSNGGLYSSVDYSLQYTSDGNVYIVPSDKTSKVHI